MADRPDEDEIEISVFGGGYGEAICVHLGASQWVLIDSCLHPDSGQPVGLDYLSSLDLDPAIVVGLVLATHWDDDHIRGLAQVVQTCHAAKVAVSMALYKEEWVVFVYKQQTPSSALGSGLDEFRKILESCRSTGRIIWAKANVPLFPIPPGESPLVVALSPSDDDCTRSLELLIESATQSKVTLARRYRAPAGSNAASVASYVSSLGSHMLLGADLEATSNPASGWNSVVSSAAPSTKAMVVKVPHHGASSGHDPRMWSELVVDDSLAIVAPWSRGGRSLPTRNDLDRIKGLAASVYITATPDFARAHENREIQRMMKKLRRREFSELRGWGQVRARRKAGEPKWRVELFDDAALVS